MKTKLLIIVLALIPALGFAQTDTTTNTPEADVQRLIDDLKSGQTNWFFEAHGLYAPSLKQHWGGGIGAYHPISSMVLYGTRLDYVNGGFWMPSGNVTIQLPVKIFSWLTVTPLAIGGVGVPVSGATVGGVKLGSTPTDNNGQPTAILGYGAAISLFHNTSTNALKWYQPNGIDIAGDRESWSGFSGYQWRVAAVIHKVF